MKTKNDCNKFHVSSKEYNLFLKFLEDIHTDVLPYCPSQMTVKHLLKWSIKAMKNAAIKTNIKMQEEWKH